jgi:hypothetical protein
MGTVASCVADGGELVEEYDIKTGELLGMWWTTQQATKAQMCKRLQHVCAW